jgi:monothiol glutaredoxin
MDATVKHLTPTETQAMLERGALRLYDVRPEDERALASVAAARGMDAGGEEELMALERDAPVAFLCHHGVRSYHAAQMALRAGFRNVHNVDGGIEAWSLTVDPSVPRY